MKFFPVVDALKGYHKVPLDEESAAMTTFSTPVGRYQYRRLPFRVVHAGDDYCHHVADIFDDIPKQPTRRRGHRGLQQDVGGTRRSGSPAARMRNGTRRLAQPAEEGIRTTDREIWRVCGFGNPLRAGPRTH